MWRQRCFISHLVQFCLWKFESKRFWCRFKERCIEGWAEGGTDTEGKKGNNCGGFVRSTTFSATLHNPVMLSPTSGCQKYPCRLPSERLPSAASLGWDTLSGAPPGNAGSYSSSKVTSALFQLQVMTVSWAQLCSLALSPHVADHWVPGYLPTAHGIQQESIPQLDTSSVARWPQVTYRLTLQS